MRKVKISTSRSRAPAKSRYAIRASLRRPILLLSCSLALVAGAFGIWRGGYIGAAVTGAEARVDRMFAVRGFAVRAITISGQERAVPDSIYHAISIQPGDPMLAVDPGAVRGRLLELPWIADAEVRRQFPDSVSVHLIEKRPFALWRSGSSLWVIERSGAVITNGGSRCIYTFAVAAGRRRSRRGRTPVGRARKADGHPRTAGGGRADRRTALGSASRRWRDRSPAGRRLGPSVDGTRKTDCRKSSSRTRCRSDRPSLSGQLRV